MIDSLIKSYGNPSIFSIFLSYIGGVLVSLTPCVYPMIPILLGVIGATESHRKIEAFMLSLSYVLGLSLTYTSLGVFASLTGIFFGRIATDPWTLFIFGNICFLLAFWMMEWINIPGFSSSRGVQKRGYLGSFLIGILSGLVIAPCTSPVLAGLLIYIANSRDVLLGGLMLFTFSLGMTTLLLLIGTFSGIAKQLPRPGKWMVWIKRGLALLLFGYGEYFIIKAGGGFGI